MEIVLFLVIGLLGGVVSGLLGIGGATLMVPALIFLAGYDQKLAQGTTLVLMVPPIGLLAAIEYYKNGNANLRAGLFIALAFFVGGYVGSKVAMGLDPHQLKRLFAIFLMLVSLKMFFS